MVAADLIKSRTYSLWLNSHKSDTGAIIFGGYDNAKYYDDIVMLDSQSDEAFVVALTDLYIFPHNQTNAKSKREPEETSSEEASATEEASASATDDVAQSFGLTGPLTALIDSSSTFTSLPKELVARLAKYVGATLAQEIGKYVLPCETNVDADLYFVLGGQDGPGITVDMVELLIPYPDTNNHGLPMTFPGTRTTMCVLGITPINDDQSVILGQTFLRPAYVFFDVDLKKVGFANAKWDVTDSDIHEVANGGSVKSASSIAGASITQSPSAARGAPGAGFTANATLDVGQPGSPVTSLEGGVRTTLSGDRPHGGNRASATESAASHSSSAAAAPAVVEQSNVHVVLLALCGSIMLVAAMLF
jgi:yapsin 1